MIPNPKSSLQWETDKSAASKDGQLLQRIDSKGISRQQRTTTTPETQKHLEIERAMNEKQCTDVQTSFHSNSFDILNKIRTSESQVSDQIMQKIFRAKSTDKGPVTEQNMRAAPSTNIHHSGYRGHQNDASDTITSGFNNSQEMTCQSPLPRTGGSSAQFFSSSSIKNFSRDVLRPHSTPATLQWLKENYEEAEGVCIPRNAIYLHYVDFCSVSSLRPVNAASFGKVSPNDLE